MVEHVADQRVEAGGEFVVRDGHGQTACRGVDVAAASLVLGQRLPERGAFAGHRRQVRARGGAQRTAGRADDVVDAAREGIHVRRDAPGLLGVPQRLRVEPQRGHRGAQPVGEVGGVLAGGDALGGEQVVDAGREPVQLGGDEPQLRRPLRGGAGRQVPGGEPVGGPGQTPRRAPPCPSPRRVP
ncbi:hypothetical protein [Streptomyces sp. YIM 121038]|uniref:hypothetical protein n=1 Tax=Streptomyces sp. YIM 121038 TaxID=2136401 RepID=UPI0031FE9785